MNKPENLTVMLKLSEGFIGASADRFKDVPCPSVRKVGAMKRCREAGHDNLNCALRWCRRLLIGAASAAALVPATRRVRAVAATILMPTTPHACLTAGASAMSAGDMLRAYECFTRGLQAAEIASASDMERPDSSMVAEQLHLRRAEVLLARGFARACAQECMKLSGPESSALRARALAAMGEWVAAADLLQTTAVVDASRKADSDTLQFAAFARRGAEQRQGKINFVELMTTVLADGSSSSLPMSSGPLRYESPKLKRMAIPGRGMGIVATDNIVPGELLVVARPLGLVLPGEESTSTNLNQNLARKLERNVLENAQLLEETLSLFDGSSAYGANWDPAPWEPLAPSLPSGRQSGLLDRIRRIVKYNAHRCPCKSPGLYQTGIALGLWLWPPMINHGLEGELAPNCAHVFVGDAMVFRATLPIASGEEVLDRYSSPLAETFSATLETLEEHDMKDPVYEAAAARWRERTILDKLPQGDQVQSLSQNRSSLLDALQEVESKLKRGNSLGTISAEEFLKLRTCYLRVAAEQKQENGELANSLRQQELELAPPEVRCLNLLCPLAFQWEGRSGALEMRAELCRRVGAARPFHFASVALWTELYSRLEELQQRIGGLSPVEKQLAVEVTDEFTRCAQLWVGQHEVDNRELFKVVELWALKWSGFRFGWFSQVSCAILATKSG